MGIIDKIFKRNNKVNEQTTDKKANPCAEYRKEQQLKGRELSEDELEKVVACTPREYMIHNLPKKDSRKDNGR